MLLCFQIIVLLHHPNALQLQVGQALEGFSAKAAADHLVFSAKFHFILIRPQNSFLKGFGDPQEDSVFFLGHSGSLPGNVPLNHDP